MLVLRLATKSCVRIFRQKIYNSFHGPCARTQIDRGDVWTFKSTPNYLILFPEKICRKISTKLFFWSFGRHPSSAVLAKKYFLGIYKLMILWTAESVFDERVRLQSANLCRFDWFHFLRPAEGFRASAEDFLGACFSFSCSWINLRRSMKNPPPTIENAIFPHFGWLRFERAKVCWKPMP